MVFEIKRCYLKQIGDTWNKEVVSKPIKERLTKSPPLEDSLEIIDIGEKVLEESEAVSAACVRSQLVVPDQV